MGACMVPWRATDDGFVTGKHRLVSQVCGWPAWGARGRGHWSPRHSQRPTSSYWRRSFTWIAPPCESRARSKQGSHTSFHSNHRLPRRKATSRPREVFRSVSASDKPASPALAEINHDKDWLSNDEADVRSLARAVALNSLSWSLMIVNWNRYGLAIESG